MSEKSKKQKITYENSKCCACGYVYINFMVITSSACRDTNFVMCQSCAKDAFKALESMQLK